MTPTRRSLAASAAVLALVASACGSEPANTNDTGTDGPSNTLDNVKNTDLAPPVPVRVTPQAGGVPGEAATSDVASEEALPVDPSFYAPTIITYVIGESINELPANDVGWQFPTGAEPTSEQLDALAAAFGVSGEAVRGTDQYDTGWRIGPDDGSSPSIYISDDGPLSWFYEAAYDYSRDVAVVSGGPVACEVDESGAEVCSVGIGEVEDDYQPVVPENVPTADEAQSLAVAIWSQFGLDIDPAALDVYADEWSASVNATRTLGGIDAPSSMSINFGANATVQNAFGELAQPIATGPYPLVALDEAVERLDEFGWGSIGVIEPAIFDAPAVDGQPIPIEPDGGIGDGAEPLPIESPEGDIFKPEAEQPLPEPEPASIEYPGDDFVPVELTVTLTGVEADLWWSWDDGTIWYLPAYTFIGDDGGRYTVPAVTDEFLIVEDFTSGSEGGGGGVGGDVGGDVDLPAPAPTPEPVEPPEVGQSDGLDAAIQAPFQTDEEYAEGGEETSAYLTRIFAGSTVERAEAELQAAGWIVRSHQPGDAVTADFSFGRANVVHVDGTVEVVSIG